MTRPMVRILSAWAFVACTAALFAVASTQAQEAHEDPASKAPIRVFLDRPDGLEPVFGEVTVEAAVLSEVPIERVVFYLDGIVMGQLTEPPYEMKMNVGQANEVHRFEVLAYGADGTTGAGSVSTPAVQVDEEVKVNLQQLYVTVTENGRRVQNLQADDFRILDEGQRQDMVTFARGDIPFTATVLLDSSRSMEGPKLDAAIQGATAFFQGMKDLDEGRLLVFSDRLLHSTPVTTFGAVLTAGLSNVRARGGSALADHLYMALKQIGERQGRRVVVLLSDGVDSHSVLSMEDVLAKARRSQAILYWLRLPYDERHVGEDHALPELRNAWRTPEQYRREYDLLERTVVESGGRVEVIETIEEIAPAFRGILAELRDQYVLGYYPKNPRHDGGWRQVEVRLEDWGPDVRSQRGYVDF